ncbi:aminotransferase class V-fold PLP-dependent enzyme [Alteromonas aestuariivivens]|uniref:Aminotransferase class V-fold PLP-dependent enzyme n=1 Tax=Alteromonas aestuariivivens TaxID=1938339 RepID=A0A3D8M9L7_9ALTE|nr:aminotransferase class V-fold PLP-dependent enzyme [Alteromonas aestuariivivens]RDV26641.1 aminotransferase class V-fold PLP-dependent enzyme [Alteromonas aestuariivivens]
MYQQFYSRFLAANEGKQHFSCHSHYYWPDVTRQAMLQYWDDTARLVDDKWQYFFATLIPELQQSISSVLNTACPQQIVFAPNTHELLFRILSCLDWRKLVNIVATDSEFHSFHRQASRMAEWDNVNLITVPTQPFDNFSQRMIDQLAQQAVDVLFISQVFFNSGFVVRDLQRIVDAAAHTDTIVVIDGYHGFMAIPTDLSQLQDRVFYLAGGYKYAQAGEGACFAHVPKGCDLRPLYTGWFAEFGALDKPRAGHVQYSQDGMRFAGATMDFSALYRMRAVFELFATHRITVADIDHHVRQVQNAFLERLEGYSHPLLNHSNLLVQDPRQRGHFLTFNLPDAEVTADLAGKLRTHGILTDFRGNRLRFGFSLYHQADSIQLDCLSQT